MNEPVATETGHRVLPHTADVIVEAWAPTRAGCLEELVRGVVDTFADTRDVRPTREIPLEVGAARDEDVIIALLDDVCYLLDADGLVVRGRLARRGRGRHLRRDLPRRAGRRRRSTGAAAPKGISRSDLQFALEGGLWRAHVIVDV